MATPFKLALSTAVLFAFLAAAARADVDLRIDTYNSPENGSLVEEVYVTQYWEEGDEWPPVPLRLNSFFIEMDFDQPNQGLRFSPPSMPTRTPFVFPGFTLLDEGSTPQTIRVSAALPDPEDFVEIPFNSEPAFLKFQILIPPDFPHEHFGLGFNPFTTRLIGPGGQPIVFDPVGRGNTTIDYVPEPTAAMLIPVAAVALLTRRRRSFPELR